MIEIPTHVPRRFGLFAAVGLSVLVGAGVPSWLGVPTPTDAALAHLLLMMAGVKSLLALGAIVVVAWRIGYPASGSVARLYATACCLMAGGAGLMWHVATDLPGAVLFYLGAAALLALGWTDGFARGDWLTIALRRRLAARVDRRADVGKPGEDGRARA